MTHALLTPLALMGAADRIGELVEHDLASDSRLPRSLYGPAHRRGQSGSGEAADYLAWVGDGHDYPVIRLAGQLKDHGGRAPVADREGHAVTS